MAIRYAVGLSILTPLDPASARSPSIGRRGNSERTIASQGRKLFGN
ncbi:MAG: hypothetical protein GPJ22_19850 [Microcystis aeruginosa LL13-03]|nr:hypothetical protein [Microcystis aeruginosa SX13-11]NCR19334.1 hypothetical protein [Microcystis aeruginosa LL13-03]NCR46996.1 hypothetical protein [Microcystis aeruginosa SX13-01]NCR69011.1 hypothetical protein [Microcystis aeruginosa LL11-07]NCR91542.1 hypothetical protein [Microcystis aeruginosa G13-10]NCS21716.1 hypothetical protein [Microcystis aeruginosa G11-06]NCS36759.1 hypothetical protein [Microcystis aeruginosa G11-01]NCT65183.1 hypothetical protein [Microcystis aeruginosa G13